MSCCGSCGGQDVDPKNEQEKNQEQDISKEKELEPNPAAEQEEA